MTFEVDIIKRWRLRTNCGTLNGSPWDGRVLASNGSDIFIENYICMCDLTKFI